MANSRMATPAGKESTRDRIARHGTTWSATGRSSRITAHFRDRQRWCHACAGTLETSAPGRIMCLWASGLLSCAACGVTCNVGRIVSRVVESAPRPITAYPQFVDPRGMVPSHTTGNK